MRRVAVPAVPKTDPRFRALSTEAFGAWVLCFCWCGQFETDGRIPRAEAELFGKRAIRELVDRGILVEAESGLEAVDFVTHNPSKAKLSTERGKAKVRMEHVRPNSKANKTPSQGAVRPNTPPNEQANNTPNSGANGDPNALPSHTLPSPPPPLDSGSSLISGSSEPSSDLTGSAREGLKARLAERLVQPAFAPPDAPPPRKDPLFAKLQFARWFPSSAMLAWCKQVGLTDRDVDATLAEARDGLTGQHDFEWFDVKVWRYLDVAVQRKANPGGTRAGRVQANTEWPTDDAARLREAIRSGQHGKALATKLEAGQLDYPLAQRLVRERQEAAGRRPDGQVGVPPPGDLSALIRGVGRAMP